MCLMRVYLNQDGSSRLMMDRTIDVRFYDDNRVFCTDLFHQSIEFQARLTRVDINSNAMLFEPVQRETAAIAKEKSV